MATKVLLLTHKDIGHALIHAAEVMMGTLPLTTTAFTIDYDTHYDQFLVQLQQWVKQTECEHDLLILTDLYGSTPNNMAKHLLHLPNRVRIISGLNLPMLVRVMNYPQLTLTQLAKKALTGGRDGVIYCLAGDDYD